MKLNIVPKLFQKRITRFMRKLNLPPHKKQLVKVLEMIYNLYFKKIRYSNIILFENW